MFISVNNRATKAYSRAAVDSRVQSATPHELIDMLYDGLLATLAVAKGAIERGDIPAKGKAITKAVRLLEEGLKASLSPLGGELSDNLRSLYEYCIQQLTMANLKNDAGLLDQVKELIVPVALAWKEIEPEVGTRREN